ncbi:MAG TPA: methyltransferase domain-containing protein [Anaerolineae bacterium]|jgi:ubiquinone/menaquinone biosynthesis C-methylase UbiE
MTDQKQAVQNQFGANAEKYARSAVFAQGESLSEMIEFIRPQKGWEVLDVATGGGHCAFAIAPLVKQVVATDITTLMLSAAKQVADERQLANIAFEYADAETLPYPDGRFDLVTCRIAAHHFSDPSQAVREMARVCKPGGVVAVIDGIAPAERAVADELNAWETIRDPSHVNLLSLNAWASLFCAANLEASRIDTFLMTLDFDDYVLRAGCSAASIARIRDGLINGSPQMRGWLNPRPVGERLEFSWHQILIIGRKP